MHVGLLGAGRIGMVHAGSLAESPLVDRLTIVDVEPGRAERAAADLGCLTAASPEAAVAAGVEALVVAAATPAHAELVRLAADAGLPVFCEKPIALDLPTTDAVLQRVAQAGVLLQVGFQRRFDAGYAAARAAVRDGSLGELLLVRAASHDPAPPPEAYIAASGGIWRDLLIHDLDAVPWVVGRDVVEVYADGVPGGEAFARHADVATAAAVLRFEGGPLGVLTGSRYDPRGYDIRLELLGSRDSVAAGVDARTPLRSLEPGAAEPAEPGYRDFVDRFRPAYRAELEAFLQAVDGGGPSPCPGEEARRALRLALAAMRSRAERRPVPVTEVGGP